MSYVALGPATRDSRLAAAGDRWAALSRRHPDLEPPIALQRRFVEAMVDLLDTLERGNVPRLSLPPRYVAAKLGRGIPAFAGEPVPLPLQVLTPVLLGLCDTLSAGGAGEAADHVAAVLRDGSMDAGSLLSASFSRDQHAIRSGAVHRGLSPDLVWLAAELAVSPFAYVLQRAVVAPRADSALAAALDAWTFGYCPACGSWPALSEVLDGRSVLRCSFCSLAWTVAAGACAYCGETATEVSGASALGRTDGSRLQTCGECRGYLKHADVAVLSPFPLLAITDLETMELDVAAMERGFGRPALKEFAASR